MNKKGYIRIIEAVVAVLIILGFIMAVMPRAPPEEAKIPKELELTAEAILKQIQNDDTFRKCILVGEVEIKINGQTQTQNGIECISKFIKDTQPRFSPWDFAFEVTETDGTTHSQIKINNIDENFVSDSSGTKHNLEQILPKDRDIFVKTLFLSVEDVTALPIPPLEEPQEPYKILKVYFWLKA